MNGISTILSFLVDCEKACLYIVDIAVFGNQPSHCLLTSLLRASALPHEFHDKKATADSNNRFSQTGSCCSTHLIIYIQSSAYNRTVPYPAVHFIGQSAGGTGACQLSIFP